MRSKEGDKHKSQMLHCRGRVEINVGKIKKKLKNEVALEKSAVWQTGIWMFTNQGNPLLLSYLDKRKQGQEAILQRCLLSWLLSISRDRSPSDWPTLETRASVRGPYSESWPAASFL